MLCALSVTWFINIFHSWKSVVEASARFVWFWLNYSLNNLSPLAPVPGSYVLSWRYPYFKPLYLLGPTVCFVDLRMQTQIIWGKGFWGTDEWQKTALLELATFWEVCSKIRRSSERISLRFVILFFCYMSSFYFGSTQQDNYKCSQTIFQRKLNMFVQSGQTEGMVRIPHSKTWTTHLQVPESTCKQEIFAPGTLTIILIFS